jgi:hypothetical protein
MNDLSPIEEACFETILDVWVLIRQENSETGDWSDFDQGPGKFVIPQGYEVCIRIKNIDDAILQQLVEEISGCPAVTCLNLSENRKVTDNGLKRIASLINLRMLNLSSCDITDRGLVWLKDLQRLKVLNLSYCNRISDAGLKHLRELRGLTYLDLQGCPRIKHAAIIKAVTRRGLTVHE